MSILSWLKGQFTNTQSHNLYFYDFDNTLAHTSPADIKAYEATFGSILEQYNINFERDIRGKDVGCVCEKLNNNFGMALNEQEVRLQFREHFHSFAKEIAPCPGVIEGLTYLDSFGAKQYIVSNSPVKRIEGVISKPQFAGVDKIFGGKIYTAFDSFDGEVRKKPLPDVYLKAVEAAMVSIQPAKYNNVTITFVEDSPTGLASALAARDILSNKYTDIKIVVVGYVGDRLLENVPTEPVSDNLLKMGCDSVIESMDNLLSPQEKMYIRNFNAGALAVPYHFG